MRVDPSPPALYSGVSPERFQENAVLCSGNLPALPKASLVHSVVVATEANCPVSVWEKAVTANEQVKLNQQGDGTKSLWRHSRRTAAR